MITMITQDNFKNYIGKEVYVEWTCYSGGILYPEHNLFLGMEQSCYYLKSVADEEGEEEQEWQAPIINNHNESVILYDWQEFVNRKIKDTCSV